MTGSQRGDGAAAGSNAMSDLTDSPFSTNDSDSDSDSDLQRMRHELRRREDQLDALHAMLRAPLDGATLLQTVVDAATCVSGAAFGAFFHRDDARGFPSGSGQDSGRDSGGAVPNGGPRMASTGRGEPAGVPMLALAGIARAEFETLEPARAAALFGAVWRGDRTVRCDDITTQPRYAATATYFGLADGVMPLRSFLAVPVALRDGRVVGGLFLGHPGVGVFTERIERIVTGVAAHAAVALENVRLVEGMRCVTQERERLVLAERAAQADTLRAARMKDEFLSTLSHELRTPLTAILGWAKVLLLQRADPEMQHRGLEAIARNADAQALLIEELLEMSRVVSGKVELDLRDTDLSRVVDAAMANARSAADVKHIRLECRVTAGESGVRGDAERLQQVVDHLLSNAIKFTPPHGRIIVTLATTNGQVELTVSDTGVGIEPEFLPYLFDNFRQADSSITRSHGGLGLGLAIVKQLVAMHGGAVSASSEGRGRGACFTVRLPIGDAAGPGVPSGMPIDSGYGPLFSDVDLHGLHLLVVDDDVDARELIAQLLLECGADVRQAGSAVDALREFERETPDLLLSDIGMPGRDGYELIRDVRRLDEEHGGNVPAVALTAFSRAEDRAQAILAGYQAHLSKPVQPGTLVQTVAGLAERRRAA